MPNLKSAKKRARQAEKRRLRNKAIRSTVKTSIRKVLKAMESKEPKEKVIELMREAQKAIDKAVSKGVFHRNEGARKKSKLMARVHKYITQLEVTATNL
ncbi:MAG: 30S ribosomal protein S20 [Thermosulfidibacteraceae bacterium]